MKYLLLLSVLVVSVCRAQPNNEPERPTQYVEFAEDTILEVASYDQLDLNRHQLFMDTSRSSPFYDRLKDWSPHKYDNQAIDHYLNEIREGASIKKIVLKDFPTHWISLRQYKNKPVLYERCDGTDRRFEVTDSSFNLYGPLESEADAIDSLILLNEDELIIRLRTIKQKSGKQTAVVKVKKTEIDFVYLLTYRASNFKWNELVTPKDRVDKFDLIVNHCPQTKRLEYQNFEKIDFMKYE